MRGAIADLYISKLPRKAIEADLFYVRPLEKVQLESQTWYTCVPVGRNKLYKMVTTCVLMLGFWEGRTIASGQHAGTVLVFQRKSLKSGLDIVRWSVYACTSVPVRSNRMPCPEFYLRKKKPVSVCGDDKTGRKHNEHFNVCSSHELL